MAKVEFIQTRTIGEYEITLPKSPILNTIDGYGIKQIDQRFIRKELPKNWNSLSEEEQEAFAKEEFRKCKEGYFFFNNGNLEYVTGFHYFYITWWYIDGKYPDWIDADRDLFYIWQYAFDNKYVIGLKFIANRREGKALDINTDIPTVEGWKKMKDIKVGDIVFGSNGEQTKVTYTSDIMKNHICYDVIFSDGSIIKADAEHLWIAYDKLTRRKISEGKSLYPSIVTTQKIKNTLVYKNHENNWSVKNCCPVKYDKKELKIPPYILGCWLGDGGKHGASITNIDEFIINEWLRYGRELGLTFRKDKIDYFLTNTKDKIKSTINPFRQKLKDYNLMYNKHIPKDYLQSSFDDRLELLKGIMDTDGSPNVQSSSCEICSKSETLINDYHELICSLGYKARKTFKVNKKYNRKYYYIRFSPNGLIPFKLQRKINLTKLKNKSGWNPNHRYIVDVIETKSEPVKCIAVDNEDHSYLCTKNHIVTHNTYKALSIVYLDVISGEYRMGGIQSKTNSDAKSAFLKLVKSWKRLPPFFKPIDSGDLNPKTTLLFEEPSQRNTKGKQKKYNFVLNGAIEFFASTETACDGLKQRINFQDETGKTVESDVVERLKIVRECCMDGSRVIGKIIDTTTVEEMEKKGGKNCKIVWELSAPSTTNPITKMTSTGLIRYFKPAYYGYRGGDGDDISFVDEYGYSNVTAAKIYLEALRIDVSMKRKYPFTIEEAFYTSNTESPFDLQKIQDQKEFNNDNTHLTFPGNFEWKDGNPETRKVEWHPNPNGKWLVTWLQSPELQNKMESRFDGFYPGNAHEGVIGADPVDSMKVTGAKGSNYAFYGLKGENYIDDGTNNLFVCEYINRLATPEMMHEDYLKTAIFYGWPVLPERNVRAAVNYFRRMGYYGYCMERPDETKLKWSEGNSEERGLPNSSDVVRSQLVGMAISYIYWNVGFSKEKNRMGRCYFNRLLDSWLEFNPNEKWTDYDETVASFMCFAGIRQHVPKQVESPKTVINIPTFDNVGNVSRLRRG